MRKLTFGGAVKVFVILMFCLGILSAAIQQRNCNNGKCSHVYSLDLGKSFMNNVRPLFEKILFI